MYGREIKGGIFVYIFLPHWHNSGIVRLAHGAEIDSRMGTVSFWMGDHLGKTLAVRSKVHSAFHPLVVGEMSTSLTGDKLGMQWDWSGAYPSLA